MPQVFRLGCAGAVLIVIAALTSVGLYAMVAGGVPWAGAGTRTTPGGAQVLVTIQAAPVTPTSSTTAGTQTPAGAQPARPTPTGATVVTPALGPAPATGAAPPVAAIATPATAGAPAIATPATTGAPAITPAPAATAVTPTTGPAATGARPEPTSAPDPASQPARASHEGLAVEIVEVERGWQTRGPDGSMVQRRDGSELVTVHVRLQNEASEIRFAADTDLVLVAEDGARLAPRQTLPLREPHLLTVPVPPRESVRGWLTYDVPAGLETTRLQWSPTRPDRPRAEATYLLTLPR